MATNFVITLDTTAPDAALAINSGAAYATGQTVSANITSVAPDSYQMKLWGDVDNSNDANVQTTEGASSWVTYSGIRSVKLSSGDGAKSLHLKIRDDVGNTSTQADASITLDTTAPVPNVTVAVSPAKISKVATYDTATVTWQSDVAIQAWKLKVVASSSDPNTAGTVIPTTAGSTNVTGGSLAATTNQISTIKGADLESASAGDGAKIVKVFVQDLAGNWSV